MTIEFEDDGPPENAGRKQGRRGTFPPGQSGNPAGKAKGTRNRVTLALEQMLEDEAEEITRAVIEKAKAGDFLAQRLVFERIMPIRRGRPVRFTMRAIDKAEDVSALLGDILKAVASGELTPDEAATVATIAEAKRKAIETQEHEARLAALEADNERRN